MTKLEELTKIISLRATDPGAFIDAAFDRFFGQDCLLRKSALDGAHVELANCLASADWQDTAYELNQFLGADKNGSPLDARVAALRVAISGATEQQMQRDVRSAISSLQNYWADGVSTGQAADGSLPSPRVTTGSDIGQRPAWYFSLRNRYRQLFDTTIAPGEWPDMAVNLTGSSVASVLGRWQRPEKPTVETWILFARKKGGRITGGLVAKLRLWKIERGNGFFYPDPQSSGYVRLQPSFREAMDNAWRAIMGSLPAKRDYDVCWSVGCRHPRRPDAWPPLVGRSGEAAIACALKALRDDEPLDENVAVTAMLEEPTEFTRLAAVKDVRDKILAEPFGPEIVGERIFTVVVHDTQPEATKQFDNGKLKIVGVDDLPAAYERLSRFAKARRSLRERIAELATKELKEHCIGEPEDGFVFPRISRRKDRKLELAFLSRDPREEPDPLSQEERESLFSGEIWDDDQSPRRIRMVADSGAGKSMLLVYCQQQMARLSDCVPLRLELRKINWIRSDFYSYMASELRWRDDLNEDEHRTIVQRLCQEGKLVLLLDALDQTKDNPNPIPGLSDWVDTTNDKLAKCPIIITGRSSTENLLRDVPWQTLQVDPFERREQEEFLGPEQHPKLLLLPSEANEDQDTVRRKQQWEPLLKIPMLLKLMKELAQADRLEGLTNRESVYKAALKLLIDRGKETLGDTSKIELTEHEIEEKLALLAWHSVAADPHFTGVVDGKTYTGALSAFASTLRDREDHKQSLEQINVFARREDGIEWRHRSFLEYFAAIYLCDYLSAEEQSREIAAVHDCLEIVEHLKKRLQETEAPDDETLIRPSDQWEWVYRFALMRAQADGKSEVLHHLARQLIAHGNPYVVYDTIRKEGGDEVVLDAPLADLCRWLVHQTWIWNRGDYTEAWQERDAQDCDQPEVDLPTLQIVASLFDRSRRRSECLPPAWRLVQAGCNSAVEQVRDKAQEIHDQFLSESKSLGQQSLIQEFLDTFRDCPPHPNDSLVFTMGAAPGDEEAFDLEKPAHRVRIKEQFDMADFPVTNAIYELFDPSHFWLRDQFSKQDDQPVVWVNWHMAELFCQWLSGGTGKYRLPTEAQWEFACRAGSETRFCWSNDFHADHCHCWDENRDEHRTLGRSESEAQGDAFRNPFRLFHMSGNVWEWCADWLDKDWYAKRAGIAQDAPIPDEVFEDDGGPPAGVGRVLRGGGFSGNPRGCRSSDRFGFHPSSRGSGIGFRVVCCVG